MIFQKLASAIILISIMCAPNQLNAGGSNPVHVSGIEIFDAGIYYVEKKGQPILVPTTKTGNAYNMHGIDFAVMERTDKINAQIGMRFGMTVKVLGFPEGAIVRGTCKRTITNPITGQIISTETTPWGAPIGTPFYDGFLFERDVELIPGN